jgi:hypothetical protein
VSGDGRPGADRDGDGDAGPVDGGRGSESESADPEGWPVALRGVTESVVATLGPNDRWNLAALGLRAGDRAAEGADGRVTARTWDRTRTRGNFERRGGGVVQFVADPVLFVDAALGVVERADPVADAADAWVEVSVERLAAGESGGTEWVDWALVPGESDVGRRRVATIGRGFNAVVEATVWASRLDAPGYDRATLVDRLAFLESVVESAGGPRDREAFERIGDRVDWRP